MKKFVMSILILSVVVSCFAMPVFSLAPPFYTSVSADDINKIVEFIETEDAENFQKGGYNPDYALYQDTLPYYRNQGMIYRGYYPEEFGFELLNIAAIHGKRGGIKYYYTNYTTKKDIDIVIIPIRQTTLMI